MIPESEGREVPCLMVEGDGPYVALQRERERRTEVKVGIGYEGWEPVGKDRYKLKEKTTYAGIMTGKQFWEGSAVTLAKKCKLHQISHVIVGGDGANWVKAGADRLGGIY